jgi:protein disulfide-isomerase-like protein
MKLTIISLLFIIPSYVEAEGVISLNPSNYEDLTAGKAVFIKFFAPWCGHCKAMASDFEKLASEHASSDTKLIAEVDCTDEASQTLCSENDVEGFPTLKHGDPAALSDYEGGRDYDSMNEFVSIDLKLTCSPMNLDLCNDEEKALIELIQKKTDDDLNQEIEKVESILEEAENALENGIAGLQERFDEMMAAHEADVGKLQDETNYKLMQSILSMKKKEAGIVEDDDDEEDFDDDDMSESETFDEEYE